MLKNKWRLLYIFTVVMFLYFEFWPYDREIKRIKSPNGKLELMFTTSDSNATSTEYVNVYLREPNHIIGKYLKFKLISMGRIEDYNIYWKNNEIINMDVDAEIRDYQNTCRGVDIHLNEKRSLVRSGPEERR